MVVDMSCVHHTACRRTAWALGGGCGEFVCPLDCPEYLHRRYKTEYIIIPDALSFGEMLVNMSKSGVTASTMTLYDYLAKYRGQLGEIFDSVRNSVEWED
ncbi:MAG: hypothetical protein IJF90_12965 [Synergistaceae bacterium]|nr:hypothetical protein [Synergistaceae bacterium]MBQ3653963.1 hypothetical protein [Synergistaceae bacterium]